MAENCAIGIANLSKSDCSNDYGQIIGMWFDELNTGVSFANALLEASWTAKVNAATGSRMYVLTPNFPDEVTRNIEEPVFRTGNTGKRRKARNGKADYAFKFEGLTMCQMNYYKTFDGANGYAYFITKNEDIIAGDDGTNLIPQEVDIFVSEPMSPENEDDTWSITLYAYVIPTSNYFTKAILAYSTNAWRPSQIDGIENTTLSVVSSDESDGEVIFTAVANCDATEINSFVTHGDFVVELVSTGALLVTTGITNSGNTYTLAVTGLTQFPHYIYRKTADLATDKGYETRGVDGTITKVTFTPVA